MDDELEDCQVVVLVIHDDTRMDDGHRQNLVTKRPVSSIIEYPVTSIINMFYIQHNS